MPRGPPAETQDLTLAPSTKCILDETVAGFDVLVGGKNGSSGYRPATPLDVFASPSRCSSRASRPRSIARPASDRASDGRGHRLQDSKCDHRCRSKSPVPLAPFARRASDAACRSREGPAPARPCSASLECGTAAPPKGGAARTPPIKALNFLPATVAAPFDLYQITST